MLQQQSLELADFSGGITDYPFKAPPNKAEELDNFIIDPNRRLIMRPGSEVYSLGMAQIDTTPLPFNDYRINNFLTVSLDDIFYAVSGKSVFYPNVGETAWVHLAGVTGATAFNLGDGSGFSSFAEWNGHLFGVNDSFSKPIKIFKDSGGVPQVRTAGLPALSSNPSIAPSAGTGSYIWYFTYSYTYQVGTTTFEDESAPVFVQKFNAAEPNAGTPANISSIPILVNASGSSYDTTNIKIRIYRTVNGGIVPYYVGEVSNGTTTFTDNFTDATIQAVGRTLYTTGGTLPYEEPPLSKYIHINNGRAYYAFTKDGTATNSNRVYHSITDDPDSVPLDFFVDVRDEIKGISSFNDNVVVFGTSKIYRIDGYFDELGRNGMTYEEISKVTGAVSHNSIIQTELGLFFAGNSGFYWTDGFKVEKISDSFNERYKTLIDTDIEKKRIYGCYDAVNLKVYWTVRRDDASVDNDSIFCLDLRYGFTQDASFTTFSNGDSFSPTAICIYKKNLIRGDRRGYVFKHRETLYSDPKIDVLKPIAEWGSKAIIWNYKSTHLHFDLPQVRKWVSQILLTAKNISNLSIQVYSINDDSSVEDPLKEIRFRDTLVWGDPEPIWGTDTYKWAYFGLVEQQRRFPAGGLRCSHKQIRITNAETNIFNSDTYSTATVDKVLKTVTLDNPSLSWPTDIEDYIICLDAAGPTDISSSACYPISERLSNTVISFTDPTDTINTLYPESLGYSFVNIPWVVRGIPKNEVLNLMSIVLYFAPLTPTYKKYFGTQAETGANE